MECTHYSSTELKVPQHGKIPGSLTPHEDLVPINFTNIHEAQKDAISWGQNRSQDYLLEAYHETSIEILKGELDKMNNRLKDRTLTKKKGWIITFGIQIEDVKFSKMKSLYGYPAALNVNGRQ